MKQKKDEQRSVELDQNLNSSTKADDTTSSSHNAKPNVGSSLCLSNQAIDEQNNWNNKMKAIYDSFGFNRATVSSLSVK